MRELALTTALGFALSAHATANAQEAAVDTSSSGDGSASNTIIVTAQRRDQALSDVPQAVQAISGEALKNQGYSVGDLAVRIFLNEQQGCR